MTIFKFFLINFEVSIVFEAAGTQAKANITKLNLSKYVKISVANLELTLTLFYVNFKT